MGKRVKGEWGGREESRENNSSIKTIEKKEHEDHFRMVSGLEMWNKMITSIISTFDAFSETRIFFMDKDIL